MNRLVIIGNGFDLFHGLNTSYKDFLTYLDNCPFDVEASTIIKQAYQELEDKNWTDIETIYYKELLICFGDPETRRHLGQEIDEEDIKDLNKDLDVIKRHLATYLGTQNQNQIVPNFTDISLQRCTDHVHYQEPSNVFILNFNYTTPRFMGGVSKVNIHGTLNDVESMIFGYGDEADEIYPQIEKADIDEFLRNFKSHCYIQSNNYKDLSEFIDADEYQVMTVGHSCGRSDHVLLGEIFNHENCKEIEVNYHQFTDGTDDFNSIAFNIGRAMPNKVEYRRKLKSKENCRTIAELHEE